MHKKKINLKIILLTIITLFAVTFGASALVVNSYLNKIDKVAVDPTEVLSDDSGSDSEVIDSEELTITPRNTDKNIRNIALFGIDESDGNIGRSDSIMILTIDTVHNKLKLTSIIRDSYVEIPTRSGKDKINHAYAFGGPKLAIQTLNKNFALDITEFASVNFSSFPKIIDTLGGIDLNITNDELKYINNYIKNVNSINNTNEPLIATAGEQHVNGTQALAYARIRYTEGGDFERSHRQRIVISKAFEKAKEVSVTSYPKLLGDILPSLKTNLDKTDILGLALDVNSLKANEIIQNRFPEDNDGDGQMINGVYYYVFDEEVTTDKIHKFIYEE